MVFTETGKVYGQAFSLKHNSYFVNVLSLKCLLDIQPDTLRRQFHILELGRSLR